jgi:hypothetical protein
MEIKPLKIQLIEEALRKDFKKLYVKEYTTGWKDQRFIRNIELSIMGFDNLVDFISQLLSERYEQGRASLFKEIYTEALRAGDLYKWVENKQLEINNLLESKEKEEE